MYPRTNLITEIIVWKKKEEEEAEEHIERITSEIF